MKILSREQMIEKIAREIASSMCYVLRRYEDVLEDDADIQAIGALAIRTVIDRKPGDSLWTLRRFSKKKPKAAA
jgi:hypothetical protein